MLAFGLLSLGCGAPRFAVRPRTSTPVDGPGSRVLVVVRVPMPWYAPRFLVRKKFREVLPEYEPRVPLQAKYFTISDNGLYGGVYLWTTREDADRHFDAAWRAGVRDRRGVDADLLFLDAPYVIDGPAMPLGEAVGTRSIKYPAWISLVLWTLPAGADASSCTAALAQAAPGDALIRSFVVTAQGSVGIASLWATREAAERAASESARTAVGKTVSATASSVTLFEAPLLIDAILSAGAGDITLKPTEEEPRR